MKLDDYKKAMDSISCTDSFRKEMEQKLSAEIPHENEFADTVTELEPPPKLTVKRIAATAAVLVIIAAAGGKLYLAAKNLPSDSDPFNAAGESNTTTETATTPVTAEAAAQTMDSPPFINESFENLLVKVKKDNGTEMYLTEPKETKYFLSFLLDLPWSNTADGAFSTLKTNYVSFCFGETSEFILYEDGLGEYRFNDNISNTISRLYAFDKADYSKCLALIDELFRIDMLDTERARNIIRTYLSNADKGSWSENGSQAAHSLSFSINDNAEALKETMCRFEWEKADPSAFKWSEPFCTAGGLMIDCNGMILDNDIAYSPITPEAQNASAGTVINCCIRSYIDEDKLAAAQFDLINMNKTYTTLSLGIYYSFSYDALTGSMDTYYENTVRRSGTGSVLIDTRSEREYTTVTDREHCYESQSGGNTIEMVSDGNNYAYIDHYTGDMPLTTYTDMDGNPAVYFQGSRFFNTPQMFYSQLRENVLAKLSYLQNFPDKIISLESAVPDDSSNGYVKAEWRGDTGTTLSISIEYDKNGVITDSEHYVRPAGSSEDTEVYRFCVMKGNELPEADAHSDEGLSIERDSPGFSMPEFTDEQQRCMQYPMNERFETNSQ